MSLLTMHPCSQSPPATETAVKGPSRPRCSASSSSRPTAFVLPSSSGLGRRRIPELPSGRSSPSVRSAPSMSVAERCANSELELELGPAEEGVSWPRLSLAGGPLRMGGSLLRYGNAETGSVADGESCRRGVSRVCVSTYWRNTVLGEAEVLPVADDDDDGARGGGIRPASSGFIVGDGRAEDSYALKRTLGSPLCTIDTCGRGVGGRELRTGGVWVTVGWLAEGRSMNWPESSARNGRPEDQVVRALMVTGDGNYNIKTTRSPVAAE